MRTILAIALMFPLVTACQSAINKAGRNVKYSALEYAGIHKRDVFKKEVKNAKESQEETGEAFKDALDRLKEVYAFDGGNLEKEYRKLNSSYEDAGKKAQEARDSIKKMETVAGDLFSEWKKEISEIQSSDLRSKSSAALAETQAKYSTLSVNMKKAEKKMDPVLGKFKDHVLYLKHNLNAQAVASLKGESVKIEQDINALIADMNKSIASAEQVIKELE